MMKRNSATLAPGCCWICRNNEGPFIDTQRDLGPVAADGQLYICDRCVGEMGVHLAYPTKDSNELLRRDNDALRAERDAALELAEKAEAEATELRSALVTVEKVRKTKAAA